MAARSTAVGVSSNWSQERSPSNAIREHKGSWRRSWRYIDGPLTATSVRHGPFTRAHMMQLHVAGKISGSTLVSEPSGRAGSHTSPAGQ